MDLERAIEELLEIPELADSPARARLECAEIVDAAAFITDDIYELRVRVPEKYRAALREGLKEYARGDLGLYKDYAALLEPDNWETATE